MSQKGHITGLAGEFFVMAQLFRLGHEAALTLGNAKAVDIFTKAPSGDLYQVSVKAIRGGGKWGVGKHNYADAEHKKLVFVLLHFRDFDNLESSPDIWVIPAKDIERLKLPWHDQFGIYLYKEHRDKLNPYKDAWGVHLG